MNNLVLIHAFPVGRGMWELPTFPEGWRVLAPSLPGFDGAPLPPADSTSLDDYARAVLEHVDAAGVDRFVVGGVSMGGYATFALWKMAAARCRGLVLVDTRAGADTEQGRAGREKMLGLVREKGAKAVADEMLPKLLGRTSRAQRPDVEARTRAMIERQTAEGIAAAVERMRDRPDVTALLPQITVPALIVVGEEDEITPPAESEKMQAAMPNATLQRIPACGHLPPIEAPGPFSDALASFLGRL